MAETTKWLFIADRTDSGEKDDASTWVRLYAVRLKGEVGWTPVVAKSKPDEIAGNYRKKGQTVEDVRIIEWYFRKMDAADPGVRNVDLEETMQNHGWAYDELAACWRAPGESMTPFPCIPARVESINVTFGPIDPWLPVKMTAGDQQVEIGFSDIFPPFEGLIKWLENVAYGIEGWFAEDIEGPIVEFFSFEQDFDDRVRIVVAYPKTYTKQGGSRKIEFDVDIDRATFVGTFYRAFRSYATGPLFDPEKWEVGVHLKEIRSEKIERYLESKEAQI